MKNFSLRQASIALLTSTAIFTPAAFGAEYVVNTATTVGYVIDGSDILTIDANGSIAPSVGGIGVQLEGTLNVINNSGSISSTGGTIGVFISGLPLSITASNGNIINNSGTISSFGAGSFGVAVGGGSIENTINNSGIILAEGEAFWAGFGAAGTVLNNSGKIVSTGGAPSIFFLASDSNLNLMAPAFIGGQMQFNFTEVDITTGRSQSVLWDFSGGSPTMSFGGDVPWAWNSTTEQFATIDPTALSAASDMLADSVDSLSELARTNNLPNEWWLKGYGNFGQYGANGINNDYAYLNGGIAAGASFTLNENLDLGAFVGYQASNLRVNSRWVTSQTILGNGVVAGIYGTVKRDNMFADLALYGGWSANSSNRFVNDNLQALGEDNALADYNSLFLAPEVRVGMDIDTNGEWTLTPSASARFSSQWIDGYTETGSNANATIASRLVQVFEGDIELAATRKVDATELTLRGGVNYRQALGATTATATLLGQDLALPLDTGGAFGAYVGIDLNQELNDNLFLDLSAKAGYVAGGDYSLAGSIGISGLF